MARLHRIALFAEQTPLFVNVLLGLKDGFEQIGIEAFAGWPPLPGHLMPAFLANFRPDAILEINRSRNQIPDFDGKILHICWLQDFQFAGRPLLGTVGGSQLTYFMNPPDMFDVTPNTFGPSSLLWPGVNERLYCDAPTSEPCYDMTLVGHQYPPLTDAVLDATLTLRGIDCGRMRDYVTYFDQSGFCEADFNLPALHTVIEGWFQRFIPDMSIAEIEPQRRFLFHEALPRMSLRCRIATAMLELSHNVRFFGSAGWGQWPQFAPYYDGELLDPLAAAAVFRATRLNVHASIWPLHYRPLDCMASGAAVMINAVRHPDVARLFYTQFIPNEDFIEYEMDSFTQTAARALQDKAWLDRVRRNGARAVLAGHTYRHRAEQIVRDLAGL